MRISVTYDPLMALVEDRVILFTEPRRTPSGRPMRLKESDKIFVANSIISVTGRDPRLVSFKDKMSLYSKTVKRHSGVSWEINKDGSYTVKAYSNSNTMVVKKNNIHHVKPGRLYNVALPS